MLKAHQGVGGSGPSSFAWQLPQIGTCSPPQDNSALDQLANASYQIVIAGSSYRERQSPHRALLDREGGD